MCNIFLLSRVLNVFLTPSLSEAKKVVLILTDGRSNTGMVSGPAQRLRNAGVVIFSVGIGQNVHMQELYTMASQPKQQRVILLNNFSELEILAERLASDTCSGKSKKEL